MNIKFAHVDVDRKDHLVEAPLTVPGLYNWWRAFDGQFLEYCEIKGHVTDYDIIMIALTTWDTKKRLTQNLRREIDANGGHTKIVMYIDYAVELWQQAFEPEWLIVELEAADILLAPVHCVVDTMRGIVPGKPAFFLPHPIDVDQLKNFRVHRASREQDCGFIVHRYDNLWWPGYMAKRALGMKMHAILGDHSLAKSLVPYFKHIAMGGDYAQYIRWMANRNFALDSYNTIHSMGRFQMDNAVLGIPTVGSEVVESQKRLWPQLTTTRHNYHDQIELLRRLQEDSAFWNECVNYAAEAVRELDYAHSRTALLEIISHDQTSIHSDGEAPDPAEATGTDG